jgi:metal-dependent hydrolase (beta-lactamase superfamily II)
MITFLKKIKKMKIDLSEIFYIFLTHTHDDHVGFFNKHLENSGAKVILNSEAVVRLKSHRI